MRNKKMLLTAALALIVGVAGASDANAHEKKSFSKNKHSHHKVEKINSHTYYRHGYKDVVYYRGGRRHIVREPVRYSNRDRRNYNYRSHYHHRSHYQPARSYYRYPSSGLNFVFKFD